MQRRVARGSREYLLDRADRLIEAISICDRTFADWGARRIIPSTLVPYEEASDPHNAIAFSEPETGRMLALRQDMTNSVRRIVDTELNHLKTPFKLYYIERVWRRYSQGSRAKEQIQSGVEWVGAQTTSEPDILHLACELASKLTTLPITLIISDANLRKAWLNAIDVKDITIANQVLDQRNLSQWQQFGDGNYPDLPLTTVDRGGSSRGFPKPVGKLIDNLQAALAQIPSSIDVAINPLGHSDCGYYSGMYFSLATGMEHDAWLRGGRYDGKFSNSADAIGFTVDLDPLMENN